MKEKADQGPLKKLIKALAGKLPYAKVGVLQGHSSRGEGQKTNADVGRIHEFGIGGMVQRSFLRWPLQGRMASVIGKIEKQDKISLSDMVYQIGAMAKSIIQEAFTNEGFGMWIPSKKIDLDQGNTLVETGQLRDSIDFEVVE